MDKNSGNKINPKIVETYAEDMAQVIGDNREGLIKKIIHQEEENEIEKMNLSPESRKNKFFIFSGSLLILATIAILVITLLREETSPATIEKQFAPLVFTDKNSFIEVAGFNKDKIVESVYGTISKTRLKNGEVEGIYLTENKKVFGFERFLELTKINFVIPKVSGTEESFINDNFLMGVVNNDFFILLKVRSILDIFNNMRVWENKMFVDLHGFFGIKLSSETEHLLTKDFADGIIENKNTRILYKEKGEENNTEIAMMYVFANDTSVIITGAPSAAREIMLRLASGRVEK